MKYEKPEVQLLAEAVKAIQGSKHSPQFDEIATTVSAYEADE